MGARIGVLALQGAFDAHRDAIESVGGASIAVRRPHHLADLHGLVIPGGESTTMSNLIQSAGLEGPLRDVVASGLPLLGTCAGMILLSERIEDGRDDQIHLDALPMSVRRNAYGRQIDSFETDVDVDGLDEPFHAVFIRAPLVTTLAPDVQVLARHGGEPVFVQYGSRFACSFHPELTADRRIHRLFLDHITTTTHDTR